MAQIKGTGKKLPARIIPVLLLFFASVTPARAAESGADSVRQAHVLRPVEVTGVKNDPSAEAVSAPVTRVSGAELRRLGVVALKGVSEIAPNVYIPDYGSRVTSSIYSRGLGARIDQPVMGLTVDNVPYLNKDAYDFSFMDIERLEVLRGARALLNGRNTMGGQINIMTMTPGRFNGLQATAEYATANSARLTAGYYGQLNPRLAMGLSAGWGRTDGFYRNEYSGRLTGAENNAAARWKTVWRPSPALALTNTASLGYTRQDGYPYAPVSSGIVAYNDTCGYRRTSFADGLTLAWAGKRVVVTSSTSVQYMDSRMQLDQDFSPEPYFTLTQNIKEWTVTEDLFTRGTRGKYSWLGGVFAFGRFTTMGAPVTFGQAGISGLIEDKINAVNPQYPITWDSSTFTLGTDLKLGAQGVALYHESSLRLGDLSLEAGLRVDFEHSSLDYYSHCNTGYTTYHLLSDGMREFYSYKPVEINDRGKLSKNYLEFLPKLAVGYHFAPAHEVYASFSRAYKAGGYNTQMFSDVLQQRMMAIMGLASLYTMDEIVSYEPEYSLNYEAGIRGSSRDGRFTGEFTVFFIDCRNQQLTVFPPGTVTGRMMTNAGRTRSMGAELTASWNPTEDLSMRASYGYTNATFRKYDDGRANYRGKHVPYAPENTLFGEVYWRVPRLQWQGIVPSLEASVRCVGSIYWNEANTVKQNFYALPSLGLTFTHSSGLSLRLWGNNLSGTRYDVFYFSSMGNAFLQKGRPRELGLTLRYVLNGN